MFALASARGGVTPTPRRARAEVERSPRGHSARAAPRALGARPGARGAARNPAAQAPRIAGYPSHGAPSDADVVDTSEDRAWFAAATGMFSPAAASIALDRAPAPPRGPACLLDAELDLDAPVARAADASAAARENAFPLEDGGFGLSTGALALVLGIAGFGRHGHAHHAHPSAHVDAAAARAAVLAKTAEATASEGTRALRERNLETLLPSATMPSARKGTRGGGSDKGEARPEGARGIPRVVCSRWFVGSLNALG